MAFVLLLSVFASNGEGHRPGKETEGWIRIWFGQPLEGDEVTSRSKRYFTWLGGIFGTLALLFVIAMVTLDADDFKWILTRTVRAISGRTLTIGGDLDVDFGWTTQIRLEKMTYENLAWGSEPNMIEIGRLDFQIKPWEMLKGRTIIPSVILADARILLERDAKGEKNWGFSEEAAAEAAAPKERTEFPIIGKLEITNSTFAFYDRKRADENQVELIISKLEATGGDASIPVELQASGRYQDRPFRVSLQAASYFELREAQEPYEMSIDLTIEDTRAKIVGSLTDPLTLQGPDLELDIRGQDMADLFPIIGIVFPPTPPYALSGHLRHHESVWSFSGFTGKVGDSDLSGTISVNTAADRPMMNADLTSDRLNFDDLGGFIGALPGTGSGESTSPDQKRKKTVKEAASPSIFPDDPINLDRVQAMDAQVKLRAKRILAPDLPIDRLDASLTLEDGILRLQPANFTVANGRFEIYASLYASKKPVEIDLDIRLRRLDLKRLMEESAFVQKSAGLIGGRLIVSGKGPSARAVMRTLSGDIFLVMSGGQISAYLVELVGLDILESLGLFVTGGDTPVRIRCLVADFKATNGLVIADTLVLDTEDTNISGQGKIDLREETLDFVLNPLPKDFSLLSLRSSVRVQGPIEDPSFFPDPLKIGTKNAFLKALNALLTSIVGLIPPLDAGIGKDSNCEALIKRATADTN